VRNTPSWDEVDSNTVSLQQDQAYTVQLEMNASANVKVNGSEKDSNNMMAYWLNETDHNVLQNGSADEGILLKIASQSFFSASKSGEGNSKVPRGNVFIYLECQEEVESSITYTVSIYQ